MKNYVIGYGSLINFESQNITGKSHSSMPIVLHGYRRSWSVTYDDLQFCALGVYPDKSSKINAVLFEIEDLEVFDQREHGYSRFEIKPEQLSTWFSQDRIPTEHKIWIYLPFPEKIGSASEKHFIWQSYVDVILMGCLSIEENFALDFIQTTSGWDLKYLNNDRDISKYIRVLKKYDSQAIDLLIKKIPNQNG
jgi:hypothetical protein